MRWCILRIHDRMVHRPLGPDDGCPPAGSFIESPFCKHFFSVFVISRRPKALLSFSTFRAGLKVITFFFFSSDFSVFYLLLNTRLLPTILNQLSISNYFLVQGVKPTSYHFVPTIFFPTTSSALQITSENFACLS